MSDRLRIVVFGLSITSSWGNGHATTYRALLRELAARGHEVWFLERDVPWYADHRDLPDPSFCNLRMYSSREELEETYRFLVETADAVIVGSYVPEGVEIGHWVTRVAHGVTAFYDIDTPVTLAKLERGDYEYLSPDLVPRYSLYLSFTGGRTLHFLESTLGSPKALPLYCSFDPDLYYPEEIQSRWDLGYMGTYSTDRQPTLESVLIQAAREWPEGRFVVAGPQYPAAIKWPSNVERIEHLAPTDHREFYNAQQFTLNITRSDMIQAGYSPSVRLFEAAACATPIISDWWEGLETFFKLCREIMVVDNVEQALAILRDTSEEERKEMGARARSRVLAEHTSAHRAETLAGYLVEALASHKVGASS